MSKVPSSLSWHLILALLGAGRHKTKVSIDQATQGQTFQARQITKEKVTKNFAPTRCVTLWGPSVKVKDKITAFSKDEHESPNGHSLSHGYPMDIGYRS